MKIGVISDIHSNIIAFNECVKYLEKEGCDEYLFLGDYVSDTPYARETLDYLYEFMNSHTCLLHLSTQSRAIRRSDAATALRKAAGS